MLSSLLRFFLILFSPCGLDFFPFLSLTLDSKPQGYPRPAKQNNRKNQIKRIICFNIYNVYIETCRHFFNPINTPTYRRICC